MLLSQFTRLLVLGVLCPLFTFFCCQALYPFTHAALSSAAAPQSAVPKPSAKQRRLSAASKTNPKSQKSEINAPDTNTSQDVGTGELLVLTRVTPPQSMAGWQWAAQRAVSAIPPLHLRAWCEGGAFLLAYLITQQIGEWLCGVVCCVEQK